MHKTVHKQTQKLHNNSDNEEEDEQQQHQQGKVLFQERG